MKDGTELTHYGVKGMKWGKRTFGKVKGVFGTPKRVIGNAVALHQLKKYNEAKNKINKAVSAPIAYRRGDEVNSANGKRSLGEFSRLWTQHQTKGDLKDAKSKLKYTADDDKNRAERARRVKALSNKSKRYSTRLNGR